MMIFHVLGCALVGLTVGQQPQITSDGQRITIQGADVNFQTSGSPQGTTISGIISTMAAVRSSALAAQAPLTGSCSGTAAIKSISPGGAVTCTDATLIPTMSSLQSSIHSTQLSMGVITSSLSSTVNSLSTLVGRLSTSVAANTAARPTPCGLAAWTPWSSCSASCGGQITRTRQVTQTAVNAVPCDYFETTQSQPCSPACTGAPTQVPTMAPTGHPCNGNERYYNLNSGQNNAYVASYVGQNVIYGNGNVIFGQTAIAAGQALTLSANSLGGTVFSPGHWLCGSAGPLSVVGDGSSFERDWVPDRLNGTRFVVPVERLNNQMIYVLALSARASVSLSYGTTVQRTLTVNPGTVMTFSGVARAGASLTLTATNPIVASIVAGVSGAPVGVPLTAGSSDYFPLVPSTTAPLYGIPSSLGRVASLTTASVNVWCNSRATQTIRLAPGALGRITYSVQHYNGQACAGQATTAGTQLGMTSIGDADGTDGTMWLPASLMRQSFIIPIAYQHFAVICSSPGTATIQTAMGTTAGQTSATLAGSVNGSSYFMSTSGTAGRFISTSVPCYIVADGSQDGDEIIIFGA